MPGAPKEEHIRAWLQTRVDEAAGIDRARPEGFTQQAWRDLCAHYQVGRKKKISTLEEALKAVADLARS